MRFAILLLGLAAGAFAQAPRTVAERIVANARSQAERGAIYDASYQRISYPKGDVPQDRGACTDVIIRALRAVGKDLQVLIHEDMKRSPRSYPRRGAKLDRNIDHRRVANQVQFFARHGQKLSINVNRPQDWRPGDFVVWKLPGGLDHIGIATDRKNAKGLPYVVHNIRKTAEEDVIGEWKLVGRYRFPVK